MGKLFEMPMVRIQVDRMQQSILAALADYNEELSSFVEAEIDRAINEFDFPGVVQPIVHRALENCIKSYFQYGHGYDAIEKAVNEALNEIFKSQSD